MKERRGVLDGFKGVVELAIADACGVDEVRWRARRKVMTKPASLANFLVTSLLFVQLRVKSSDYIAVIFGTLKALPTDSVENEV